MDGLRGRGHPKVRDQGRSEIHYNTLQCITIQYIFLNDTKCHSDGEGYNIIGI